MDVFYNKLEADPSTIGMDVVGGRLDLVSATSINWGFQNSNQIRLVNPDTGRWELVKCSTEPQLLNTTNDLNGTALVPNTIYDVFAEYSSSTAFNLVLSRWATGGDGANNSSTSYATPGMTANNAPGPVVLTNSSEVNSTYTSYKAFTQTNTGDSDSWQSAVSGSPYWIMVNFGQPVCINKYAIQSRNGDTSSNWFPSTFKLQGSNDGTNFTTLETEHTGVSYPGQNSWSPSASTYYQFENNKAYQYYRLYVTHCTGNDGYCVIGNLKLVAASNSLAGGSSRVRAYESTVTYAIGDRVTYGGHDWVKQSSAAAGTTPVAGNDWVDNGTSVSGDFSGLYRHDGVLVSDSSTTGKSRRWLGIIYTYNNSGTVNFKDDVNYRFVSNFYNTINKRVITANTTTSTVTNTSWAENPSQTRGLLVKCCSLGDVVTSSFAQCSSMTSIFNTTLSLDVTNGTSDLCPIAIISSIPSWQSFSSARVNASPASGYHFITMITYQTSAGNAEVANLSAQMMIPT